MKRQILAMLLILTMLFGILPMNGFAVSKSAASLVQSGLQSNHLDPNDVSKSAATEPVILAGYTTASGTEEIRINGLLGTNEGWVLPGQILYGSTIKATFGVQWDGTYLYFAVQRKNSSDRIYVTLNGVYISVSKLERTEVSFNDSVSEFRIPISQLNLGTISSYNTEVPVMIEVGSGDTAGRFSGKLRLSSVNWWKTSNESNCIAPTITYAAMRGYDSDLSSAVNRGYIGGSANANELHLWDYYNAGLMGSRTMATFSGAGYEGMNSRSSTVYFSFDFKAAAMPEYELAEAAGGYHFYPYYANFGFTWQMSDALDNASASNVAMGGIVNTADGLYLNVSGRYNHTLKLDKKVGDTFNVGLAWHSNGDLAVYIDGVERGYYTGATKYFSSTSHVVNQGVRLMCWRDELNSVDSADDNFDLYITNMALGTALPDTPVKALSFNQIKGSNTSAEAVTSNLTLPTTLNGGIFSGEEISWESSNSAVISPSGNVTRPARGAEKVTLTAKDSAGNRKEIDVVVLGNTYTSYFVKVVEGDIQPSTGKAVDYTGKVFHLDSNNNSLVCDQGAVAKVNVIKLTDLDEVSRLNRETISIWTSNDNVTYTRVEDNYKLLHVGKDWYLYNFEANARYIKVNYTLYDGAESNAQAENVLFDSVESDFANVLDGMMIVYYESAFGANGRAFSQKTVTVTNNTPKKQQDYAWRISTNGLGLGDLSKIRVKLDNEYLYHYVDGSDLYVRIPDLEKGASVSQFEEQTNKIMTKKITHK